MVKYIALYDCHFGEELFLKKGRRERRITHNPEVIASVVAFMRDFKPDVIILGGDQIDAGSISDHNKGKPRLVEGLRLTDDYDYLNSLLLNPLDEPWAVGAKKVWLTGNHENRVRRYLDANPSVTGLVEPEVYLRLESRGWLLQEEEVPYEIGKLGFVHGHACFPRGACKDPANKLVNHYRRSMVCGHLHTYCVSTAVTPADASEYYTGTVCPSLGVISPGYRLNAPGNENLGFVWGYSLDNGDFTLYTTLIANGRFTVNGKTYGSTVDYRAYPSYKFVTGGGPVRPGETFKADVVYAPTILMTEPEDLAKNHFRDTLPSIREIQRYYKVGFNRAKKIWKKLKGTK